MKKKLVSKVGYKKNTALSNHNELIDIVKDAQVIFMKAQTSYSDDSESMLVEIHFKKEEE
jgi:hypothetical protein